MRCGAQTSPIAPGKGVESISTTDEHRMDTGSIAATKRKEHSQDFWRSQTEALTGQDNLTQGWSAATILGRLRRIPFAGSQPAQVAPGSFLCKLELIIVCRNFNPVAGFELPFEQFHGQSGRAPNCGS
jgi:hypothetical protein